MMMPVMEKAKDKVAELLARRSALHTYEERVQYALDLVEMHLQEENPERIDECIKLYTDDAIWEAPARGVAYVGRSDIRRMYLRIFEGSEEFSFEPVDRYATPERVFLDAWARFKITGDAFENCPYPIGTRVKMRLLHSFHIRDGMIERENGYEIWLVDEG